MSLNRYLSGGSARALAIITIFFSLAAVLYAESAYTIWRLWSEFANPTYSHGLLLLGVAIYATYSRVSAFPERFKLNGSVIGFIVLSLVSFLWGGTVLAGLGIGHMFFFVLILAIILWVLFGSNNIKILAPPVLLLSFGVPVWDVINQGDLQVFTAYVVAHLVEFSGYLVYREGIDIFLNVGQFRVAENCSGMRQIVVSLPMAVILASLYHLSIRITLLVVLAFFCMSILSNIIRIYIVVIAGQLTNMQHYFVTEDHVMLGWVVFAIMASIAVYLTGKIVDRYHLANRPSVADKTNSETAIGKSQTAKSLVLAIAGLLPGPLYVYAMTHDAGNREMAIPHIAVSGWLQAPLNKEYEPGLSAADKVYHSDYQRGARTISIYMNYYALQKQDREAVSDSHKIYDDEKWRIEKRGNHEFSLNDEKFSVNEITLADPAGKRKLLWHWYYVNGTNTGNRYHAKLASIFGAFTGSTGAAVFILAGDDLADEDEQRALRYNLLSGIYTQLIAELD